MTQAQRDEGPTRAPFWFFDREARMLVRWDGRRSIYLPDCDNSANILACLVTLATPGSPMPAGAYEDLFAAFAEIFGASTMYRLEMSGEGTVVNVLDELGVDDLEGYLETVEVPAARLLCSRARAAT